MRMATGGPGWSEAWSAGIDAVPIVDIALLAFGFICLWAARDASGARPRPRMRARRSAAKRTLRLGSARPWPRWLAIAASGILLIVLGCSRSKAPAQLAARRARCRPGITPAGSRATRARLAVTAPGVVLAVLGRMVGVPHLARRDHRDRLDHRAHGRLFHLLGFASKPIVTSQFFLPH